MAASEDIKHSIIDSHIHLYAAEHLSDLAWTGKLPDDHVLKQQNSVEQWLKATVECPANILGFVFLETDRKSGHSDRDWQHPIEEIEFLSRISSGAPEPGEGHIVEHARLALGIVPWAPIAAGREPVIRYLAKAKQAAGSDEVWQRIRGFRYLVQSKPSGTMLRPEFVEGLLALEEEGTTSFDLGVDARSGGLWQLHEAGTMLEKFHASSSGKLNLIANHMCKPNLHLSPEQVKNGAKEFEEWKVAMQKLASFPNTYMKLSGLFSELPSQVEGSPMPIAELLRLIKPWLDVVFTVFGSSRIMFGSDWPVCNVGGPGPSMSWQHWYGLVVAILNDQKLSDKEKADIWAGTAITAYGLDVQNV